MMTTLHYTTALSLFFSYLPLLLPLFTPYPLHVCLLFCHLSPLNSYLRSLSFFPCMSNIPTLLVAWNTSFHGKAQKGS